MVSAEAVAARLKVDILSSGVRQNKTCTVCMFPLLQNTQELFRCIVLKQFSYKKTDSHDFISTYWMNTSHLSLLTVELFWRTTSETKYSKELIIWKELSLISKWRTSHFYIFLILSVESFTVFPLLNSFTEIQLTLFATVHDPLLKAFALMRFLGSFKQ